QVYFACAGLMRAERGPIYGRGNDFRARTESNSETVVLMGHIVLYSGRQLSFENDALDAFQGLLSRSMLPTCFGIPIFARDEQYFTELWGATPASGRMLPSALQGGYSGNYAKDTYLEGLLSLVGPGQVGRARSIIL